MLLGDTAHVRSPIGGPGPNLDLTDTINLGWKLVTQIKRGYVWIVRNRSIQTSHCGATRDDALAGPDRTHGAKTRNCRVTHAIGRALHHSRQHC
ncbi:FAD-dependent monooxygenase [Mycobacterium lepromatosis]|uniref:FAD-dependent monooxygenase n=1 Tax=Mycobacterium lepromatosis TaxID=480418 RepID=UPI00192CF39F